MYYINIMIQKNFERLLDIGIALSGVHDLDKLLDFILKEAQALTGADSGSIYLVNKDKLIFKTSRSNTYFKRWGEEETKKLFKSFEMPITKASISGYVALTSQQLNIPDVRQLPPGCDFHYNPEFDRKYNYETISMLVMPMLDQNSKIIGVLQMINCMENGSVAPFSEESQKIISSFSSQAAVAINNTMLTDELKSAQMDTILKLCSAAEFRDKETGNHVRRMSHYSRIIAKNMGLPEKQVELIFAAAPMHDIGKVGIPDSILQKQGILTPEERLVMEKHTVIGSLILKDSVAEVLVQSRIIALTHHEKVNGTGYPRKLKGGEIPIEGKIVALADVYDALSSRRCYKEPFPEEKVLSILNEEKGKHFEPKVIDAFLSGLPEIREIKDSHVDTDEDFDKFGDVDKANLEELSK